MINAAIIVLGMARLQPMQGAEKNGRGNKNQA